MAGISDQQYAIDRRQLVAGNQGVYQPYCCQQTSNRYTPVLSRPGIRTGLGPAQHKHPPKKRNQKGEKLTNPSLTPPSSVLSTVTPNPAPNPLTLSLANPNISPFVLPTPPAPSPSKFPKTQ